MIAEWESRARRRALLFPEGRRWRSHLTLTVAGLVLGWAFIRVSAVVLATQVADRPFGLLNRSWLPAPLAWLLAVALLDLSRYAMHFAHHRIPLLWRLHKVHHSDPDVDVSTALRFHPIDLLIIQAGHLATVWLLAPPPGAVVLFECLTTFQNFFAHANAVLPARLEARLRPLFVTPEMHRIHHSEQVEEQNSNFGDLMSIWDFMFGTHMAQPAAGHAGLVPGLRGLKTSRSLNVWFILGLPFRSLGNAAEGTVPAE